MASSFIESVPGEKCQYNNVLEAVPPRGRGSEAFGQPFAVDFFIERCSSTAAENFNASDSFFSKEMNR
jgi:hypothetical protein